MSADAGALIRAGAAMPCAGSARFELSQAAWRDLPAALRDDPLDFAGLWADTTHVHALFGAAAPVIVSVAVEVGLYGALSPARPGAALFERAVADLWGHQAADAVDPRPWLDHGTWPTLRPMSDRPAVNAAAPDVPEMLPADGDVLAWGPLPPNLVDAPVHWRAGLRGGRVTGLEARGGYGHRGVLAAMRGRSPATAARLAARTCGAATVAHSVAFARAVEAAVGVAVPPRAAALRTALGAVERVAVTLHDLAATAAALDLPGSGMEPGPAALAMAREGLLAACGAAAGHRLLMDAVRPGGVEPALPPDAVRLLDAALEAVPDLVPAPWLDWPAGLGVLAVGDALALGVPGAAGRASGRLDPATPGAAVDGLGDLRTRMRLRAAAMAGDVALAREALATLPDGPVQVMLPTASGEALGFAKGPQGRVWHWVRLHGGVVAASFALDPAFLLLPACERAANGTDPALLAAVAASFGLHMAGAEL